MTIITPKVMQDASYIISCVEEYEYIRSFDKTSKIFTYDYTIQMEVKKYEYIENIYANTNCTIDSIFVKFLVNNFYRDCHGLDLTQQNGISIVQALTQSNEILLGRTIRDYFAYKKLHRSNDNILYSNNINNSLKLIFKNKNKFDEFNFKNIQTININHGGERFFINEFDHPFYKYYFSSVLRCLSDLFKKVNKNKKLLVSDWTFCGSSFAKDKIVIMPSLRFWRTAYFAKPKASNKLPEERLFCDLIDYVSFENFLSPYLVDKELIKLIYDQLKNNYNKNHKTIYIYYNYFRELIDHYIPSEIIFPSFAWDLYVPAIQYASKKNISISVALDGFTFTKKIYFELFDYKNKYPYVKNFYSQGEYMLKENIKHSSQKYSFSKISAPITDKLKNINYDKEINKYDLIIMSYMHDDINPLSRPDLIGKILEDLIYIAINLNYNNIAIKIKGERERGYVLKIINYFNKVNQDLRIDIIDGSFHKHINKAKMVIGGISTAAFECITLNIPYYTYEPPSNGYSKEYISDSVLSDLDLVATSISTLKKYIAASKSTLSIPKAIRSKLVS